MQAGARLGPYTIVAPIGAGGMGEVYRARDTRLGREVAIKVLPADFASDPERLRRFEQEARAASALNHPNILTVHDIGSHEGAPYLVTELLEGETLGERLKDGPFPARKTMELAVQVASGLAAAHEKGIVHRDIKPGNVFVSRDGHVKILDFGLAKLLPTPPAAAGVPTVLDTTAPGLVMGTAAYMSPEQVRGQPIDHRSDIFSLGVVLYEVVTGRPAFARETGADTMTAILKDEPPETATIEPTTPLPLSRAIAHCLEKRPEDRFQSARDLAFDLRAMIADTGEARTGARLAHRAPRRRLTWIVSGAAAIMVLAAGAIFVVRGRVSKTGMTLEPKRIVVAVFENQTGEKSLDPLGRMASDWITQGLSRIEGLEVVPGTSLLLAQPIGETPAGAGPDPLRALSHRTGAGTIVSGAYYRQGQTLQFQVTITDAVRGRLVRAIAPVTGVVAAPMEVIDRLRQEVMGAIVVSLGAVHDIDALESPPRYDAYLEFIAGFELFGTDNTKALLHFERAAELDPEFPVPMLYAAYIHHVGGNYARAQTIIAGLGVQRERLTPLGRSWLDALSGYTTHHYFGALQHLRLAEKRAPQDPLVNMWLSWLAILSNRPQEAVDTYGRLTSQPWPGHPMGATRVSDSCIALHMLGDYRRELEEARKNQEIYPELLRADEVRALAAVGQVDTIDRVIEGNMTVHDRLGDTGTIMLEAALELRAHGHRGESIALASRAVTWYRSLAESQASLERAQRELAESLCLAGRWDEAHAVYERLAKDHPETISYAGHLGVLAARAGRRGDAERIAEQFRTPDRPFLFGSHTRWRACIAAQLGDTANAVALLREALGQGSAYGIALHRDLDLEPLHGYPPFEELLKPKG